MPPADDPSHSLEPPTVLDKPPPRADASTPTRAPPSQTNIGSEQAIAAVELQRVRGMMSGIAISSAITAAMVILVHGEPTAMKVHAGALIATALAAGACTIWFHREVAKWILVAQVGVLMTGFYFWGFFSAYCALVPLTLYILAGIAKQAAMVWGLVIIVLAQTSFGTATILGWLDSRSLVEPVPERAPIWGQFVALGVVQGITVGAFVPGRSGRNRALLW